MNEFLAELYGTGSNVSDTSGGDLEKMAQAEVLDQVLAAEGYDLNQMSGDDIVKVANALFGTGNEIEKMASTGGGVEPFEEKVAEADFLGRVMAHSMTQELGEIEKGAASWAGAKAGLKRGVEAVKRAPGRLGKWMKEPAATYRGARAGAEPSLKGVPGTSLEFGEIAGKGRIRSALEAAKKHKGQAAVAGVGGAAALGGAGYGAHRAGKAIYGGKRKEGSAIDMLAEQAANQWIAENAEPEKTALDQAVEQRMLEMLAEAGYIG